MLCLGKKSNQSKETTPTVTKDVKLIKISENSNKKAQCDDLPKLTKNLRDALQRIKNNQHTGGTKTASCDQMMEREPKQKPNINLKILESMEQQDAIVNVAGDINDGEKMLKIEKCDAENIGDNCLDKNMTKDALNTTSNATADDDASIVKEKENEEQQIQIDKGDEPKVAAIKPVKLLPTNDLLKSDAATIQINKAQTEKESPNIKALPRSHSTKNPNEIDPNVLTEKVATTLNSDSLRKSTASPNSDTLRKSTASPVTSTWKPKPVKKLIIQLNADSSSTDTDDNDRENQFPSKTDSNSSNDNLTKAFHQRLDQFLQSVRKNTDANQEIKKIETSTVTAMVKSPKKSVLTSNQKQQVSKMTHVVILPFHVFVYIFLI